MKKIQRMIAPSFVLAMCILHAGCMTEVGTDGDSAEQPSKASEEAVTAEETPNVSVDPSATSAQRVWKFIGSESCLDICGRYSCGCLGPICPGTPVEGQPCNYTSPVGQCFSKPRRGSLSSTLFSCG